MDKLERQRVILIIENDRHLLDALISEIGGAFKVLRYFSIEEIGENDLDDIAPAAAIAQMQNNTLTELSQLTRFFSRIGDIPILLTTNYDCDYQLIEQHLKLWTHHIFFRPFEVDKLVNILKSNLQSNRVVQTKDQIKTGRET